MHNSLKIPLKQLLGIRTIGLPFIKPLLLERKYFLWVWGNDNSVTEYLRVHGCYLDGVSSGAVTSTHVTVTLCHSPWHTQISVLPVHVMSAWPWVIPQPDTKVLDLDRRLLWNLKTTIHITEKLQSLQYWEVVVIAIIRNIIIYTTTYLATNLL